MPSTGLILNLEVEKIIFNVCRISIKFYKVWQNQHRSSRYFLLCNESVSFLSSVRTDALNSSLLAIQLEMRIQRNYTSFLCSYFVKSPPPPPLTPSLFPFKYIEAKPGKRFQCREFLVTFSSPSRLGTLCFLGMSC